MGLTPSTSETLARCDRRSRKVAGKASDRRAITPRRNPAADIDDEVAVAFRADGCDRKGARNG
jgi:hypothetical protein